MNDYTLPERVYVVVSHQHKGTLHADGDCHAIQDKNVREVDRSIYPTKKPCQICTDYGGDLIENSEKGGKSDGYHKLLKEASSLDDIREGTV